MAEYWTGKKWVSDAGKSVADLIGVPKIYKGARGDGQMYSTIIPRAMANATYKGIEPTHRLVRVFMSPELCKECDIHVLRSHNGSMIVYHGTPRNYYPEYFIVNNE